jgi:hypothetical protein
MSYSQRGASKLMAMIFILVAAGALLLFVAYRAAGTHSKRSQSKEAAVQAEAAAVMSEEQRVAYLEKFVSITEIELVPDTKPDSDEVVPGLFRVKGVVTNRGDQKLDKIMLAVYPENAQGEVIGSYIQNIAGATGLEPGGTRDFHFQVPEKKEYGGKFRHTLR